MTNYVDTHVGGSPSDGPASHSGGRGGGMGVVKPSVPLGYINCDSSMVWDTICTAQHSKEYFYNFCISVKNNIV